MVTTVRFLVAPSANGTGLETDAVCSERGTLGQFFRGGPPFFSTCSEQRPKRLSIVLANQLSMSEFCNTCPRPVWDPLAQCEFKRECSPILRKGHLDISKVASSDVVPGSPFPCFPSDKLDQGRTRGNRKVRNRRSLCSFRSSVYSWHSLRDVIVFRVERPRATR